jgi:hypothetical protein
LRWTRDTLYPLKLALTSPTSGGGIVRLQTQAMEFSFFVAELLVRSIFVEAQFEDVQGWC